MNNLVDSFLRVPRDSFFTPFEQVFDQIINEVKTPGFFDKVKANSGYPKMNIWQDDKEFGITVNVAGVDPDNLKIEIEDNLIRISGQAFRKGLGEGTGLRGTEGITQYFIKELTEKQFVREVKLPKKILDGPNASEPNACVKNGILTLTWSLPEIKKPTIKTIAIKQE
jgi:HSP20 family molecular chaperone IbpA